MAQLKDTVVFGNLRVTDTTFTDTLRVSIINAPSSSGGTTFGPGTNGQVLKSNGTTVYWGSDSNSVTGVKGNAESSYRTGNVNLTPANIGALALTGGTITNSEWKALIIKRTTTNSAGVHFENSNGYLGAIGMNTVDGTLKRWKSDSATSYEIIDRSLVRNNTSIGTLGWTSASVDTVIPTINTIAYWNGAYSGTSSNLAYCKKGEFGSIVTKNTTDYSKVSFTQTLTSGTEIGSITIDSGSAVKLYCQTNTDENVKATLLAASTADAGYYPTLVTGAGTAGVNIFDSIKFNRTKGTTAIVGNSRLVLGNATNEGSANNEEGLIRIYSPGTKYHTIKGAKITSDNVEHTLPTTGGTILNTGTTGSSTTNGKVKINGSDVTVYTHPTKTAQSTSNFYKITVDATGHVTTGDALSASNLPSHTHSYLPLSGGTVTGAIKYQTAYDSSLANNGVSSGIKYPTVFNITDTSDKIMARIEGQINSNGNIGSKWYVRNCDSEGTQLAAKGISMTMSKTGVLTYTVDEGAAFRTAIGAGTSSLTIGTTSTTAAAGNHTHDSIEIKTLTASTIDTTAGTYGFGGSSLIGNSTADWVGLQVDASNDRFQLIANNQLLFRQNDSPTMAGNWGAWIGCITPNNVSGDTGITITKTTTTIGSGDGAYTYNSGVKISHSNSVTVKDDYNKKFFTHDAQGHITATSWCIHDASGTNGSNNDTTWIKIATLVHTSTYNNAPITITFTQRGSTVRNRLTIRFSSVNSNDPSLALFLLTCDALWALSNSRALIVKTATSTWDIYIKKLDTHELIHVSDFDIGSTGSTKLTWTWKDEQVTTTPADATEATKKVYSTTDHTHGNITSGGALQTTDITIASGDKLVVTDSSDSNKVARTSIAFGSSETTFLRNDGSWATPVGTTYTAGNHLSLSSNQFSVASYCKTITDWNSATTNGWYMGSSVTNAPSTAWWFGRVIAHNAKYCLQEAWAFSSGSNTDARYLSHKLRWFKNNTWGNWVDFSIYHVGANSRTVMSDGNGLLFTSPTSNAWAQGLTYNDTSGTKIGFIGAYGGGPDTLSRFDIGVAHDNPWFRVGNGNVTIYDNGTTGPKIILRDRIGSDAYLQYSVIASDNSENTRNVIKCASYDTNGAGLIIGQGTGGLTIIGAGDKVGQFEKAVLSTDKNPYGTTAWSYGTENLVNISDVNIYFVTGANNMSNTAFTDWTDLKTVILDSNGYLKPSITNKGSIGTSGLKWASMYATMFYGDVTFSSFANATADADRHVFFKHNTDNKICTNDNFKYNPSKKRLYCTVVNRTLTGGTAVAGQDKGSGVSPRYFPAQWKFNAALTPADGDTIIIKTPSAGHASGVWLSVNNGTTYYPISNNNKTRLQTQFASGQYIELMFKSDGKTTTYPIAGADTTSDLPSSGGCWVVLNYYDSGNSNTVPSAYCTTAAGTAAKTATCTNYALTANTWLHVLIQNSNTASGVLTLSVNSKTAKTIYINGVASSSSNKTLPAGTYLVYYDGTNYQFRTDGKLPGSISGSAASAASIGRAALNDGIYDLNATSDTAHFDGTETLITSLPAASGTSSPNYQRVKFAHFAEEIISTRSKVLFNDPTNTSTSLTGLSKFNGANTLEITIHSSGNSGSSTQINEVRSTIVVPYETDVWLGGVVQIFNPSDGQGSLRVVIASLNVKITEGSGVLNVTIMKSPVMSIYGSSVTPVSSHDFNVVKIVAKI